MYDIFSSHFNRFFLINQSLLLFYFLRYSNFSFFGKKIFPCLSPISVFLVFSFFLLSLSGFLKYDITLSSFQLFTFLQAFFSFELLNLFSSSIYRGYCFSFLR